MKNEFTSEESVLKVSGEGHDSPLISIQDNKVNVTVLKVSMSRKHRIVMVLDLWCISIVTGLSVYMAMLENLKQYVWWISITGFFVVLCAIGKAITDFMNWLYTINIMQDKMGEWYCEDVVGICHDFITAGTKVAAEEVSKAKEEKTNTEEDNGGGKASNP